MHQSKVCEDVLQTEPKDLLVFALLGNGSDQIELRGNVCNMELLFVQKNQIVNLKHTVCFFDLMGTPLRGCPVKRLR